jgi:hypothetical protein
MLTIARRSRDLWWSFWLIRGTIGNHEGVPGKTAIDELLPGSGTFAGKGGAACRSATPPASLNVRAGPAS